MAFFSNQPDVEKSQSLSQVSLAVTLRYSSVRMYFVGHLQHLSEYFEQSINYSIKYLKGKYTFAGFSKLFFRDQTGIFWSLFPDELNFNWGLPSPNKQIEPGMEAANCLKMMTGIKYNGYHQHQL
jgi:hypothetical protein